jgi:hypothetical protein
MNSRSRRRLIPLLLSPFALLAFIPAQALCAPIPLATKTSPDADRMAAAIQESVREDVQKLANDDPEVRRVARETLINDASAPGGTASTQYLDTLAAAMDAELSKLAKHDSVLVRLNVAIVTARVADKADNGRLRNTVQILTSDKNEGVLIWALKAARDVIPGVLRNPLLANNDKLLPAIAELVQAHPTPPVIQEAYQALMLNYLDREKTRRNTDWKSMVASTFDELAKVLQIRLDEYKTGVPPEPLLDTAAANFLVHPEIMKTYTDQQRVHALQLICDLMGLAAQRSSVASGADREHLVNLVKNAARALQAAATYLGKERDIKPVIDPILQANQTTPNLPELVSHVIPALQKIVPGVNATTLPSTRPAH